MSPVHEAHLSFRDAQNVSISHFPGVATRSLETCTHVIPMPNHAFTPIKISWDPKSLCPNTHPPCEWLAY